MSIQIQLDEATAARRRVPFRLFTSNGTAPDTGASNDSVVFAVNSSGTIVPDVLVQAVESAQGMYFVELSASNVSVLGEHAVYHTQGDFGQHIANLEIVAYDPFAADLGLNDPSTSELSTMVNSVLSNNRINELFLDALVEQPTSGSFLGDLTEDNSGTQRFTSAALINAPTGSGATAGAVARQVWTEVTSAHRALGSFGLTVGMVPSGGSLIVTGSTTTCALGSGETDVDDVHNGAMIFMEYTDGTVVGTIVDDYTGTGQVVTFKNTLPVTTASGMTYTMIAGTPETDLSVETIGSVLTLHGHASTASVVLQRIIHSGATIPEVGLLGPSAIPATAIVNDALTAAKFDASVSAEFADANWDEARSGHVVAGTFGEYILTDAVQAGSGVTLAPGEHDVSIGSVTNSIGDKTGYTITAAEHQNISDSLLSTDIGNSRYVQEAIFTLRNRVDATGSIGTVYHPDDTTSAFTFSKTTGGGGINSVNPAGP